jgi:hypothetical protein
MAKNLPAGDRTGASDPFVVVRCCGLSARSSTKYETLNPGFFETLELKGVHMHFGQSGDTKSMLSEDELPKQVINVMVYDEDIDMMKNKKKTLLGRTIISIESNTESKSYRDQLENNESLEKKLKLESCFVTKRKKTLEPESSEVTNDKNKMNP